MHLNAFLFCMIMCGAWLPTSTVSESHFETFTYNVQERREVCDTIPYQTCSGFWFWQTCNTSYNRSCRFVYDTVAKTGTKCQNGWRDYPGNCDIPICTNTQCTGGQVCVAPDKCECVTNDDLCAIAEA